LTAVTTTTTTTTKQGDNMKDTIYQAFVKDGDTAGYILAYCGDTEQDTLRWLAEQPSGGIYKNTLHVFSFEVKPGEY
jgi:hypothetical protein